MYYSQADDVRSKFVTIRHVRRKTLNPADRHVTRPALAIVAVIGGLTSLPGKFTAAPHGDR
jgi:hypothetical protein